MTGPTAALDIGAEGDRIHGSIFERGGDREMRAENTVTFVQFQVIRHPERQVITQTALGTQVGMIPERFVLYGLDGEGQLWVKDGNIRWEKVTHPERVEVETDLLGHV